MHYSITRTSTKYVLSRRLKQSVLLVGSRTGVSSRLSGQQLRTPDGRKCWAGNAVRQVDDGWRNADAAACQHWRPGCSAPTDTVLGATSSEGFLVDVCVHAVPLAPDLLCWSTLTFFCRWLLPSVHWRCRLGGRKGIRPIKNWVVGCWHGYLSGARCRLAYGPADATATHFCLLQ